MSQKPLELRREDPNQVPAGSGSGAMLAADRSTIVARPDTAVRPDTAPKPEAAARPDTAARSDNDSTRTRDADAEDRARRVAVALLSSARHELRSPLQALLGFSELLESSAYGALSSAQRTFVDHMRTAGSELAATVDVCTELANTFIAPTAPSSHEQTGVMDALAMALSKRTDAGPVRALLEHPVDGALLVRCSEAALVRAIELALAALVPFATQQILMAVDAGTERVCIDLVSDRCTPGELLLEVDQALAAGVRGRSFLWLKLASVTLEPFDAIVSCAVNHRSVRLSLERHG